MVLEKVNYGWIDFLKGLSIFAVVLDHLYGVIYLDPGFHLFTVFSVTLFIFLAGVTSVISIERNKLPLKEYQIKRIKGVVIPFVVASIIYSVINQNYYFDVNIFLNELILFKASPPFYFVLFYLQLIIVSPILYKLLIKSNIVLRLVSLVAIYFISRCLTHYTEVYGIYGGGGRILGGSYLFVFFLGMLFFMIYKKYGDYINRLWIHFIGIVSSAVIIYVLYSTGWLNIGWSNPPNKQTIIYTCAVLVLGYSLYMIMHKTKILTIFTALGKYSLYIFLYHMLAINFASQILLTSGLMNNPLFKSAVFLSFAIIIPTLIGYSTINKAKIIKRFAGLRGNNKGSESAPPPLVNSVTNEVPAP